MWRAYYEISGGRLVSVGTVFPAETPAGLAFREYADPIDMSKQLWDDAAKEFIVRPTKVLIDRFDDLLNNPDYADFQVVWGALNADRRTRLRNMLIKLLGRARWRAVGETVVVEPE